MIGAFHIPELNSSSCISPLDLAAEVKSVIQLLWLSTIVLVYVFTTEAAKVMSCNVRPTEHMRLPRCDSCCAGTAT